MLKRGGKYLRGMAIGLIAGTMALLLWQIGVLESWEAPTWAWRARFFSARETLAPEIKLILLDQASLDWAQRENGWGWPWPREVYGAISAFCERGGARAVALDLLFTEPSVYGVSDDEAMGEALKAGPPVVLALMPGGSAETWPESVPRPDHTTTVATAIEPNHLLFPVPEVAAGAAAFGHVAGLPDADGVFRRVSPICRFDNVEIPALGLATYLAAQPAQATTENGRLRIGDKTVPLDERGDAILRFRGRDGLPEVVSAAAVIQSELRLRDEEPPVLSPAGPSGPATDAGQSQVSRGHIARHLRR